MVLPMIPAELPSYRRRIEQIQPNILSILLVSVKRWHPISVRWNPEKKKIDNAERIALQIPVWHWFKCSVDTFWLKYAKYVWTLSRNFLCSLSSHKVISRYKLLNRTNFFGEKELTYPPVLFILFVENALARHCFKTDRNRCFDLYWIMME